MSLSENKENENFPLPMSLEQLDLSEYEDNELVQEVAQDLWIFFQSKNCECRMRNTYQCFEKVGFKRFFEQHMQFRSLDKKELDLVLIGQLMAFEYNQTNKNAKQKFNYQFNNDIKLCKNTYLKLIGVGNRYLIQINKSLINKGLVKRLHGNTKRISNIKSQRELIQKRLDDHKQKAEIERDYYHNNILTSTILPDTAH
ncbi:23038_t:CDS:2, partial [Racocetra persica]